MAAVETARLYLRRLQATDLDEYYQRIYADPDVMCTLLPLGPISRANFTTRVLTFMVEPWAVYGFGPWAVIYKPDTQGIGHGLRGCRALWLLAASYRPPTEGRLEAPVLTLPSRRCPNKAVDPTYTYVRLHYNDDSRCEHARTRSLSTKQAIGLIRPSLLYGRCQAIMPFSAADASMTQMLGERG